jgi:RAB protein geranylgeranyltransferase component A
VYKHDNKLWKVPVTLKEGMTSSLMGLFQKKRFIDFMKSLQSWKIDDTATWGKQGKDGMFALDSKKPMMVIYSEAGLDNDTSAFVCPPP